MTGLVKEVAEVLNDEKRCELVLGTHKTKRIPHLVIILNEPDSHYQWQAKAVIEGNSETLANIQELLKMLKPHGAAEKGRKKKPSETGLGPTATTQCQQSSSGPYDAMIESLARDWRGLLKAAR